MPHPIAPPSSAFAPPLGAVLAAGLGTRLRPLTAHRPKPLVPLGAGLLVERALDALAGVGAEPVGLNVFHLGEQWATALEHRHQAIEFVHETVIQGTGGGLRGIAARLHGRGDSASRTLVAINGDALFDFDLAPLLGAHRASGALGTLVLRRVPADSPFARVAVDAAGRVHRIAEVEAPTLRHLDPRDLTVGAYTGVQFLEPPLVAALPPEGECDVLRTAWRDGFEAGWNLRAVFAPDGAWWADVGTVPHYLEAHRALLDGRLSPRGAPVADAKGRRIAADARVEGTVIGPAAVLPGAVVAAGATVGPFAWIGAGAVVQAGVTVRDAVVWPGVTVRADAVETVVLPEG